MTRLALRWMTRFALLAALLLGLGLAARALLAAHGPGLAPWHTILPEEPSREALARMSWAEWERAEAALFAKLRDNLARALRPEDRVAANRYNIGGPLDPARLARDWNRSQVLAPDGPPRGLPTKGAAVLLHGLTDAPYSLRHAAQMYRDAGWVALVPRMPGHGTVPAGLTRATWEDWQAAVRVALREAAARANGDPIHLVGYSNGGALALQAALDALRDPSLPRASRVVLLSPMVGVSGAARFAGIAGWPALLPRFAAAAWLGIEPEFNPHKYNSFPVNAARQSHRLSAEVQRRLASEDLSAMPPVLAFQSVVDATVSTPAVVAALFGRLPANGGELVLFDINRAARLGALVAPGVELAIERLVPPAPRRWALTFVTNAAPGDPIAVARRTGAGETASVEVPVGAAWPRDLFSLSHVALPFPVTDALYGAEPDPLDLPGLPRLGAVAARGERGVLAMGLESLLRASSNPFWEWTRSRMEEGVVTSR